MCGVKIFQALFGCCSHQREHRSSISESQSRLVCGNNAAFNFESPVDLRLGTSIYVSGIILKNCEGFAINMTLGHTHNDIALHINPRLPQNYIVRNSKINGRWGKEETTASLPFKLKRGERFAMQILVTEDTYLISVNGLHFTNFAHRIPYQRVTCVQVKGDVSDVMVEHFPIMEYPNRSEQTDIIHSIDLVESFDKALMKTNTELVMPYYGRLLSKFINGSRLHIVGRVKVLPYSFYINLQQGDIIWPHPSIPFHFNVRFTTIGGKNVIVKNSWLDGRWDREERSEIHTDFMPSRIFHLEIVYTSDAYHVFLNDKLITEFHKRTDPSLVDTVFIYGDIKLKYVSQEPEKGL
ncbi:galectin-4-like isoform X2 [Sitodiplosis mosellana]|uniref:galectin-4-like isoform X2 n=1 Tax=Sitodiplosis mosellana TaxID=263140 RepID=UPI0024449949|nr:galectin-4-like isoform X2 [Sitodiplosis mosellana]